MIKTPPKTCAAHLLPTSPRSPMPNQTSTLTPDEQELLRQYRARASPATIAAKSPVVIDPILISDPSTSSLSLSTQVPLSRPAARSTCTPSSAVASPSPSVLGMLPAERLAQRRTIKRHRSLLESGTEDSGGENSYGGAAPEAPISDVGLQLDNLAKMHEAFAKPQSKFIISEASGGRVEDLTHLFAERDAWSSQLLSVVNRIAMQMKEGDVQAISHIRTGTESRKKMKVERTLLEQHLNDLAKVRTSNYN